MESIFNQTFQDFEVILLDDCSTDNSREIIETYRNHEKVKEIVYNQNNSGAPIFQWLKGIALANSEWIYIAESDDTCHSRLFEDLAPQLSYPDLVLAMTEVQFINEADESILRFSSLGKLQQEGLTFVRQHMLTNCYLCNSGMAIFRKSAIPPTGSWLQELKYSPDYYFWIYIMLQGRIYSNGEVLANFRKHAREFTHGKWDSLTEHADHAHMLYLLKQQDLLSSADIEFVITYKLVGLATRRKGMNTNTYDAYSQCWRQLADKCGLNINAKRIAWLTFQRKLRHRLGLQYS